MRGLWDKVKNFVRENPGKAIAVALVANVLSIIMTVTFDIWFPVVAAAGIGAYVVYDWYKTCQQQQRAVQNWQSQAVLEERCQIIRQAVCDVVNAVVSLLPGVFSRLGAEDIIISYEWDKGIIVYWCTIPHLPGATLETNKVLKYLKSKMNAFLNANQLRGVHCATVYDNRPLLNINQLDDTGTAYIASIIVDENMDTFNYLEGGHKQSVTPALTEPPIDIEF